MPTKRRAADGPRVPSAAGVSFAPSIPRGGYSDPVVPQDREKPAGAVGTVIRGGRIQYEEWNLALENERGYGEEGLQGIFDQMRKTDPHIRRSLQLLKLPIRSAQWVFEPANDSDAAREHADYCTWGLFDRLCWDNILREALLMFDFGFMLFEILEEPVLVPRGRFPGIRSSKAIVWSAIDPRLPRTVDRWVANPARPTQVAEVVQYIGGSDSEGGGFRSIPAERLLRFTHEQEGGNFQGTSVLRSAYKPWKIVDHLERLDAIRHERQNVGTAIMALPDDPSGDLVDKAEAILTSIGSHEKGFIVEPFGWKFRWETSGSGEGTNVHEAIERYKRDIADNVLAGFMALGGGDTGSYALAETQADIYLQTIEAVARYVEEVWNKGSDGFSPVRRLIDLNYGPQERYPRLKATNLKSRDYGQIIPLVAQLLSAKALTPSRDLENFLRGRLDLPPMGEDEEIAADVAAVGDDTAAAAPKKSDTESDKAAEAKAEAGSEKIYGYHLENAVVSIDEARAPLGLGPKADGHLTVPEFLAKLGGSLPDATPSEPSTEETPPDGQETP